MKHVTTAVKDLMDLVWANILDYKGTQNIYYAHIHARWSKLGQTQVKRVVFVQT